MLVFPLCNMTEEWDCGLNASFLLGSRVDGIRAEVWQAEVGRRGAGRL